MEERGENTSEFISRTLVSQDDLRLIVRRAIQRRRQAITFALAELFSSELGFATNGGAVTAGEQGWTKIESLSQLRAVVGGRFQNLKQKWVSAGFPLREHRGDRAEKAAIDQSGWLELSVWISRQGFEARLAGNEENHLFEVRKLA